MSRMSSANRRYLRRFAPTMIAYVVAVFAVSFAVRAWRPEGLPLVVLAVIPALPILALLWVFGAYLAEETDEFVRQRHATAMLFATGVLLAVATVGGFLQIYCVLGKLDLFWGFPLWCVAWGLTQCALFLRDRMAGGGE